LYRYGSAVVAGLLLAVPAAASTFYIAPGGSDGNSGLSLAAAWATVGKANSTLKAGDVVILAPGTYSSFPAPNVDGTATSRITYVGSLANPGLVVVGSGTLTRSYVTIKGVSFSGFANLGPNGNAVAQHDSIAFSIMTGLNLNAAKYCMIARNTINGTGSYVVGFLSSNGDQVPTGFANCERDTMRRNIVTISGIPTDSRGMRFASRSQYCVIDSNNVSGTFSDVTVAGRSYLFRVGQVAYFNTFVADTFSCSALNQVSGQAWAMSCMRDSVYHNSFKYCLFKSTGSYPIEFFMEETGDTSPGWDHDNYGNVWDHCRWDILTPDAGTYYGVAFQDGALSDTVQYCVVNSPNSSGFWFQYVRNGTPNGVPNCTLFDHNTVYSGTGTNRAPLDIETNSGGFESGAQLKLTNNIFYTRSTSGGTPGYCAYYVRPNPTTGVSLVSDYNLVTSWAGRNQSIYYAQGATGKTGPGTSGVLCSNGAQWFGSPADCNSIYGSPSFQDSSSTTFDPHLRAGSIAISAGAGGSDLGAMPYGADVIPPSTVADLDSSMVNDHDLILHWTAPGGDGTAGRANAYDLRYSTTAITSANFSSATPVSPQPSPAGGGTAQSYVMQNLTAGTHYYFAIKAVDASGNWSALSNVLSLTTRTTDAIPPARVGDLGAN
jgi:hypothetical protein